MKALIVNWMADHWLIALAAWGMLAFGLAMLWVESVFNREMRRRCSAALPPCNRDCQHCQRPCVAPFGAEEADGFHLGAELMPREEVERQLTAALEQRWEDDPDARRRLGEFKAALEEWHEATADGTDRTDKPAAVKGLTALPVNAFRLVKGRWQ